MNYRRLYVQNSYVHIVIVSYNRQAVFVENIELFKMAIKNTMKNYPFKIIAICVLPDHIHMIIHPQDITQYPKMITSIKYYFSKNVGQVCPTYNLKLGYKKKREKGIFQRRYYEHTILNESDFAKQLDYIHYNPVKHGLVQSVENWEFSSFHKFVENKLYEKSWGSSEDIKNIKGLNYE